jgi:hypothetical protein
MSNDWRVLGLEPGVSPEATRARWLELVKSLHPDRHDDPAGARRLAEVNAAYDRLRATFGEPDPAPAASTLATSTFSVNDFRPTVFEAVLLAAVDVGDVTHADEPFSLDMWVDGGSCHVEVLPEAGGSVLTVDCFGADAAVVSEALAAALARMGFGVSSRT